MNKEELINLIQTLDIKEIKSCEIQYYKERSYGYGDDRNIRIITFNNQ